MNSRNESNTNFQLNISNIEESPKKNNKKKCIIIISIIAGIIIIGTIIGIIVATRSGKPGEGSVIKNDDDKNNDKEDDKNNDEEEDIKEESEEEEENEPIFIDITYHEDELKFFDIEKNISSKIIGEANQTEQNNTFYYTCTLGIKNKIENENINDTYYEGFFAILSQSYYNESLNEVILIKDNIELVDIINKQYDNSLLQQIQKTVAYKNQLSKKEEIEKEEEDYEELVKPFLKIEFYKNGSYRNIYRPYNLSQNSFTDMKEFLDIIIPKISNETFKSAKQKRRENINKKMAELLDNKDKKVLKIRRRLLGETNDEDKSIEVKDINSNESYYLEPDYEQNSSLIENEEEIKTNINRPIIKNLENNETQLNTSSDSAVYSDFTKFRGSNITTNISTILDSNNTVKEIFAKSFMRLFKQEFLKKSDKDTYDSNNYLEEQKILTNETEINVTKPFDEANKTEEQNLTETEVTFNLNDANSIFSYIDQHIKVNSTSYKGELIKVIYDNYLDNYEYEDNNNSTLRMLRALKNIFPIKDITEYEIIEVNERLRKLEEEDNKYYYGLKKSSYRKNVFQTDFLGLDIAFGITNTYIPGKGQSIASLKMDLGDFKISHDIKSFRTNQQVISENFQQMSFKLIQLMYMTHKTLQEKNVLYHQKISSIIQELLDNNVMNVEINNKFTKIEDYYSLISKYNQTFETEFGYLLNNITTMNIELNNTNFYEILDFTQNILGNYFDNITKDIYIRIEEIKRIILEINEEIENYDMENIPTLLLEEFNSLVKQIKIYINGDLQTFLMEQIKEDEIVYMSHIRKKINELSGLNNINILQNIIQNNTVFNYICKEEEKEYLLSNISNIKNIFLLNITSSLNTSLYMFSNELQKLSINNISSLLPDLISIADINQTDQLEKEINEYFSYVDKIDETINDIVTKNIKHFANILYNTSGINHDLFNDILFNTSNNMIDIGKNIKKYLLDIKIKKIDMIKEFHNNYFEDRIYKFYEITNKNNEYILKENSGMFSSFDNDFINSLVKTIKSFGKERIKSNFDLAYQYLNEAKAFVDKCLSECAKNKKSFWGKLKNFFLRDCDCEYYINIDLINNLQKMSIDSYQVVLNSLNSSNFIKSIEEYYYSFQKEFNKFNEILNLSNLIYNQEIDYTYLKSIKTLIDFNFTLVKDYIMNNIRTYLLNFGIEEKGKFLKEFNDFSGKKEGTVSNKNYDIKIDEYYVKSTQHTCSHRYNFLYIKDSNNDIINNMKGDKTIIVYNYNEKLKEYKEFYKEYYMNLLANLQLLSNTDNYYIDLYFFIEDYSALIKDYLDGLTNFDFIDKIINDFINNILNNTQQAITEDLENIIDNFTIKYNNTTFFSGEQEMQFFTDKIQFLKYINYTKGICINNYVTYIKNIINNKIDIIYDLNKNIYNYILSDEDEIKNEIQIIKDKFNELGKIINDYELKLQQNINDINITKSEYQIFEYDNNLSNIDYSLILSGKEFHSLDNATEDKISIYMKKIKINKEIDRLMNIINKNKLFMGIDYNLLFEVDKSDINLFYEQIKLNITKASDKAFDDYILPQTNEMIKEYSFPIFEELDKNNTENNVLNEIFKNVNNLTPIIDGNISSEVRNDLNNLYEKLFNLIGKKIKLKYEENETYFDYENETYYNIIKGYVDSANTQKRYNGYNDSINNFEELMKDITLMLYKRVKEKNIGAMKLYLNKIFGKYENLKNVPNFNSLVSKLYEDYKEEDLINSYQNTYKNIIKSKYELSDLNINKTSIEDINNIIFDTYMDNFDKFKKIFIYENNKMKSKDLIDLIDKKIEDILLEIKNVIHKSFNEIINNSLDGYYLKRHIINMFESKNNDNTAVIEMTSDFIEINNIKMDYVKSIKEKMYDSQIKEILIENFENSLEDYFSKYYKYEINEKIILLNNYYYSSMIDFSEQFIINQLDYIKLLLKEDNNYSNSSYKNLMQIPEMLVYIVNKQIINNNDIYNYISYMNNKNILIQTYLDNIFDYKFMQEIYLKNDFLNSFYHNNTIYKSFENNTYTFIQEESRVYLMNYFSEGVYNLFEANNSYQKLNHSINLISLIPPVSQNETNNNLSVLLDELTNQYDQIKIKEVLTFDKGLINSIIEEINKYYKENILEEIINIYSNFTKYFNLKFEDLIDNEIDYYKGLSVSYEIISEYAEKIRNISKNYTDYILNEIETYNEKLKLFGMIDGLINIPIEMAEQLRALWDYSPSSTNLRNLDQTKKKKIDFTKMIEYYNSQDKSNKTQILSNMEKIFDYNHSFRNLEEYNTKHLFNSSSEPLRYNNISDMIAIIVDDITDFQNIINNDVYFTKFISKYETFKKDLDNNQKLIEINMKFFIEELSKFSFFNSDNYNYIEKLANYTKYSSNDRVRLRKELYFINSVKSIKFYEKYKQIIIGIISSTYTFYTNMINIQSKILTTEDIKKYNNYINNIYSLNILINIITNDNIFVYSKNLIENKLIPFNEDVKFTVGVIIEEEESNAKYEDENSYDFDYDDKKDDKKNDKKENEEDDDEIGELIFGYEFDNKQLGVYSCYSIDLISVIMKSVIGKYEDEYSIKFPCASFPFLQLRLYPKLDLDICFKIDYQYLDEKNYPTSILGFDFSTGAKLGLKVEGGIYLNVILASASLAVGVEGTVYEGKIGLKLAFDFKEEKVNFSIYIQYFGISFEFYVEFKIRILIFKKKFKISYELKYSKKAEILSFEFDLYDKRQNQLL